MRKTLSLTLITTLLLSQTVSQATSYNTTTSTNNTSNSAVSDNQGSFGLPRVGNRSTSTRITFDLLDGVRYLLVPSTSGLRIEVSGARVIPALNTQLGPHVREYRAGGGQISLVTPHPLSLTRGWRATESIGEAGNRTLVLDFGRSLVGGADMTTSRYVRNPMTANRATMTPNTSATQSQINQAWQASRNITTQNATNSVANGTSTTNTRSTGATRATNPNGGIPARPLPATAATSRTTTGRTATAAARTTRTNSTNVTEAPGDDIKPDSNAKPAEAGSKTTVPSEVAGRVPGVQTSTFMAAPRIGPHPGMTRMVLDLPAGASYRVIPSGLGLRVELGGVTANAAKGNKVSSELRSWQLLPSVNGANLNIVTGNPTSEVSGWRADLLPPAKSGGLHRLVLDLSPAFANIHPVSPAEKTLASVPPMLSRGGGLALLTWQNAYVQPKVVIDAGHGGKFPGAVGSVVEKQVNLAVAKRVESLLTAAGVKVIMSRSNDTLLSQNLNTDLMLRAKLAKKHNAQLFISIHANALERHIKLRGYGIETWWNRNHSRSLALAKTVHYNMISKTAAFDRGIKNKSLSVLRNNSVPAVLVEVGFVSHPIDGLNLLNSAYLDRVAIGIAAGVREALIMGITADGPSEDMQYVVTDDNRPAAGGVGGGSSK